MPLLIQIEGLDSFKNDVQEGAKQINKSVRWAMVQSTNAVKNTAQRMAPYKTGTLRRSIFTSISDTGFKGTIAQDSSIAPYGIMQEYGTKPHVILPINRRALYWPGASNPYKKVFHPGFRAKAFMFPAFEQNVDTIKDYFSTALEEVVLKMAGRA